MSSDSSARRDGRRPAIKRAREQRKAERAQIVEELRQREERARNRRARQREVRHADIDAAEHKLHQEQHHCDRGK